MVFTKEQLSDKTKNADAIIQDLLKNPKLTVVKSNPNFMFFLILYSNIFYFSPLTELFEQKILSDNLPDKSSRIAKFHTLFKKKIRNFQLSKRSQKQEIFKTN